MAVDLQGLLGNVPEADAKNWFNQNAYGHLMRGGFLGLLQGKYDPNAIFSGGGISRPPWSGGGGSGGGGTSPPPPPPPGPDPVPRWAFPDYTQDWAFTPPAPFYTAPPPVFSKTKYK